MFKITIATLIVALACSANAENVQTAPATETMYPVFPIETSADFASALGPNADPNASTPLSQMPPTGVIFPDAPNSTLGGIGSAGGFAPYTQDGAGQMGPYPPVLLGMPTDGKWTPQSGFGERGFNSTAGPHFGHRHGPHNGADFNMTHHGRFGMPPHGGFPFGRGANGTHFERGFNRTRFDPRFQGGFPNGPTFNATAFPAGQRFNKTRFGGRGRGRGMRPMRRGDGQNGNGARRPGQMNFSSEFNKNRNFTGLDGIDGTRGIEIMPANFGKMLNSEPAAPVAASVQASAVHQ